MADKEFKVKNGLVVNTDLIWANNGQIGFNTLSPDANVTIVGTANVQGNSVITGTLSVGNTISVLGNATFSNTVTANGNLYTRQSLFVNAVANIQSTIYGSANLSIVGNTTLGGTLSVGNTTLINGPTTINAVATFTNATSHTGAASFSNTVTVLGLANLVSNANVAGNINIAGNTALAKNITVTGNASFSNSMVVTGNATFSNTLAVTGAVTLYNTINSRYVYEFLVANNASLYTITGQWRFSNSVTLSGAVVDSTGYAGSTGQVLISNNTTVYWGSVGSASITAPGDYPANTQIIFNDRGSLSSNGNFTYNKDNYSLTVPAIVCSNGTLSLNATSSYFFSNGLISFGINNPSNKLHVVSSVNTSDGVIIRNTSTGAGAQSIVSVGTSGASGLYIGQAYSDKSAYINLQDNSYLTIASNNATRLYLAANGNFGVRNTSPAYPLEVSGVIRASDEVISTGSNGFRITQGNFGTFFRNDGTSFYLLSTASGSPYGSWNSLRPFTYTLATGAVSIDGTGAGTTLGGSLYVSSSTTLNGSVGINGYTTINNGLTLNAGDLTVYRPGGTTGVVFLNSAQNRYLYYDGSSYQMPSSQLYVNGQLSLNLGNYNSYAPTLTGGNASGNWNINSVNITQYTINQSLGVDNSPTFHTLYSYIMYDRNDNSYYIDPGSTSRLNDIRPNIMYLPNNTGYRLWGGAGDPSCRVGAVYADSVQSYGAVYGTIFYDQNDANWYCDPNGTSRLQYVQFGYNRWHTSEEGWNRLYFANGDSTYLKGGSESGYYIRFGSYQNDTRSIFTGAGDFYTNGNVTAYWSDRRLKKNIRKISTWRDIINGLNGYWFEWNELGEKIRSHREQGVQVGLVAQEVNAVLPQAAAVQMLQYKDIKDGVPIPKDDINYDPENPYLTVREDKLIPVLVEAIKGLMEEVDALKAKLGD